MDRIDKLEQKVKEILSDVKGAHDFSHLKRVEVIAKKIARDEGGNIEIISAMSLLHDLVRPEEKEVEGEHTLLSASKAEEILKQLNFGQRDIEQIVSGILSHSLSSKVMKEPETLEEKILFDADKIDGLGHIGISRWFMVASHKNWSLEESAIVYLKTLEEFKKRKGRLYTESGSKIAYEKYLFSIKFMETLLNELKR